MGRNNPCTTQLPYKKKYLRIYTPNIFYIAAEQFFYIIAPFAPQRVIKIIKTVTYVWGAIWGAIILGRNYCAPKLIQYGCIYRLLIVICTAYKF